VELGRAAKRARTISRALCFVTSCESFSCRLLSFGDMNDDDDGN